LHGYLSHCGQGARLSAGVDADDRAGAALDHIIESTA
jgi:hypothetical protein